MQQQSFAATLAALNTATITAYGTPVTLPGGTVLPAEIVDTGGKLIRSLRDEGGSPEKRPDPIVFVFGPAAWGVVKEGMVLTVGTGAMLRTYKIEAPLHPEWAQGQVVELVVNTYPS